MKKVFWVIMAVSISFVLSSCAGQSCCGSKNEKTSAETATCNNCGKSSCDKSCSSNTAITDMNSLTVLAEGSSCKPASLEEAMKYEKWFRSDILPHVISIREIETGYEFLFEQNRDFDGKLLELVQRDMKCCSGYSHALVFDPNGKTVRCQFFGSAAIKQELAVGLPKLGLGHLMNKTMPSCNLDADAQIKRGNDVIQKTFSRASVIRELPDGYDLVFPHSPALVAELNEIAAFERKCCATFTWEVVEEPVQKLAHLKVFGSQAIKQELKSGFEQFGLGHLFGK